ncbi:MAG: 50S ribosomal protein L10 [Clostridiales Family XIII bacterium]|jgi:large subunit ribosomal protein L10|nr:50S ribosomal protein L10 [Clostridiales Family XIII bacterium]
MPSQQHLQESEAVVAEIKGKLEGASSVVVIDYIGTTVEQASAMRNKLREAGVDYKVYKNTLMKRAIAGTANEQLADVLDGPSAFAFGAEDATAPARVLDGVMKEYKKMSFKAGIVDGTFYDAEGIKQIATIPSRDILIGRFLGSIQSPIGKLVRTFAAIADAQGEGGAAASAPAAEDAPAEAPAEEAAPAAEEAAAEAPAEEAAPAEDAAAEAPAEEDAPAEEAAPAETEEAAPAEEAAEEAEEAPAEA